MPPENPPPNIPPLPVPPPPGNYAGYETPPPPPNNYPNYAAPPPPRNSVPGWVWVIAGCVGCIFVVPVLAAILFPVFAQAREKARQTSCMSNLKQAALANSMYVQDYDELLPMASNWQEDMIPYVKNEKIFYCPADVVARDTFNPPASYAFNSALDMMKMKRLGEPQNTVLHYDSIAGIRNASDALTSLPSPGRHMKRNNISFVDGHVKSWPDSEALPQGQILPDTP